MHRVWIFLLIILSLGGTSSFALSHKVGLGVALGSPTGISFAYRNTETSTIQAFLGWSALLDPWSGYAVNASHARFAVDYLFRFDKSWQVGTESYLPFYIGVGGEMRFLSFNRNASYSRSSLGVAIRGPLGLRYDFKKVPLEIFGELAPSILIVPLGGFDIDASVGIRYYFQTSKKRMKL